MAKDPAFMFYSSDFLVGTLTMTDEQVGKYIRLLCMQHQNGGYLSEKDMLYVCKTHDDAVFSKFKKNENGQFYNHRLLKEAEKRANYSQSRSQNRKGNKTTQHMLNISKSYEKHMENENIYINNNSLKSLSLKEKDNKKPYGEFKNVMLTDTEYQKVNDNNLIDYIDQLSNYKESSGKKYRSDYATIRQWKAKNDRNIIKAEKTKGNTADYPELSNL